MHTKDMLAEELRKVGLDRMADVAAQGYYHDFLSPLATPELQLVADLADAAKLIDLAERKDAVLKLRLRVINGDFDASKEESDAWAESPEGQATLGGLIQKKPRPPSSPGTAPVEPSGTESRGCHHQAPGEPIPGRKE